MITTFCLCAINDINMIIEEVYLNRQFYVNPNIHIFFYLISPVTIDVL